MAVIRVPFNRRQAEDQQVGRIYRDAIDIICADEPGNTFAQGEDFKNALVDRLERALALARRHRDEFGLRERAARLLGPPHGWGPEPPPAA